MSTDPALPAAPEEALPAYAQGLNSPAATSGADHRRAGADAGRGGHRQDRGAHRAAGTSRPQRGCAWPSEILCVTFTNKAAREMRDRVGRADRRQRSRACRGSAPSIRSAPRCCAAMPSWSGCRSNYTIIDTDDQLRLLKQLIHARRSRREALARAPARRADRPLEEPRAQPRRSRCRGERGLRQRQGPAVLPALPGPAESAQRLRFRRPAAAHAQHPAHAIARCCEQYQQRFKYILVDEYQDTNQVQYLWLRLLAQDAQEHLRGGGRRPVDLFLARRGSRQHPAVREGFSRRQGDPARAELPLDPAHPRRRLGPDQRQQRTARQDAVDRDATAATRSA